MVIDVLTLFPNMFDAVLGESIIKRAQASRRVNIRIHNIRDYSKDRHRKADDRPFGGGAGMVLNCQPVLDALFEIKKISACAKTVLMSPQGRPLDQNLARRFSQCKGLILIAGHYEGLDDRISDAVDEQVSIGDYILTGGELPVMVLIDAVVRLLPGVLGDRDSNVDETFQNGLLEYPHYTRPADYDGKKVPQILLSGNHEAISLWRRKMAVKKTMNQRPDLIRHIRQLEI